METQKKPQPIQPKPPTPVADGTLTEEVRRLSGYTIRLHTELENVTSTATYFRKHITRCITWGVFLGIWCFVLSVLMLLFVISLFTSYQAFLS